MQATQFIWHNGTFVPWDEAKVHVLSHSLHYGSGAFEGIRAYQTSQGTAIFRLKEHVERLIFSVNTLNMQLNYTLDQVAAAIINTVRINELSEGYIRPIVFYGYGKMGVNPVGNPTEFMIACWPWGSYLPYDNVDIKTSRYIRVHPRSTVVNAKLCGHYLNSLLASLELQGTHYHEVLLLDERGYISEGAGENFFMVRDGVLYTPNVDTILPGITRSTIIELGHIYGYRVVQTNLSLEDAYKADEAFLTGTAAEVTPIRSINDHMLKNYANNNENTHSIAEQIKKMYQNAVHGREPALLHHLTWV